MLTCDRIVIIHIAINWEIAIGARGGTQFWKTAYLQNLYNLATFMRSSVHPNNCNIYINNTYNNGQCLAL